MVCFVILHYIAEKETVNCIESIINNVKGEKHIIVVDNASPNDSGEKLQARYEENPIVDVLISQSNLGFAKGNNIGYKYALERYDPDFIVVMNNDMIIEQETFIEEIKKSYNEYNYAIMGPDIYSTKKNDHQNPQTRKILSLKELKKKYYKLCLKYNLKGIVYLKWKLKKLFPKTCEMEHKIIESNYVDHVVVNPLLHGSCYVFSKVFTSKNREHCFFDKTFMYMEAEILHYIANRDDLKQIYYPNVKVIHLEDISTNQEYSKQYDKSIFTIRCLMNSCKAFIDLIERDNKKQNNIN